ncbi:MAG: M48 family metallopeptidase [Candidatus Saccharimonadales bacterium]
MATKNVTLDEIGSVTLYKRRGNRSLRLSVSPRGEVRVSMPHWLPYKAGEQFALSKASWILAHQPATLQTGLQHGQRIGKAHRLYFASDYSASKVSTRVGQGEIRVTHPAATASNHQNVQAPARRAGMRALRKEAAQLLPQRLQTLSEKTGLAYHAVKVKPLKTRWGSCSSAKDITLNIFLMQLPWHLIDYVLVHELAHTKVMRHGPPFWQELEKHVPLARQLRKEIGQFQPTF